MRGGSRGGCAGALRRRETRERAMNAMAVVVIAESLQLSRQVDRVPEEDAVQVLAPDRADQTLNERVRNRCVGDRFDFLDREDGQVGEPAVEAKQRVVDSECTGAVWWVARCSARCL